MKNILVFHFISGHRSFAGSWNSSAWKPRRTRCSFLVNTMAVDDQAQLRASQPLGCKLFISTISPSALYHYCGMTPRQGFRPMRAQLSLKASLPPAEGLRQCQIAAVIQDVGAAYISTASLPYNFHIGSFCIIARYYLPTTSLLYLHWLFQQGHTHMD